MATRTPRRPGSIPMVAALMLGLGCTPESKDEEGDLGPSPESDADTDADTDTDTDTDSDSDTDADTDADTDTDSDTDADTDTDTDADVDCENPPAPAPIDEESCVTEELVCGDSVQSTTEGGTSLVSGADYASSWACAVVGSESYTGIERMHAFAHPGTGYVNVLLDSPCEDLDLFAIRWIDDESCLQSGVSISECEADVGSGGGSVSIYNNVPSRYVIIVEGEAGEEAPYSLTIDCD